MVKYLYGSLHQTKKYQLSYTDNGNLVLMDNENYKNNGIGAYEFPEKDLLYLKNFIDKAYEKVKNNKRR